ncbi:MAG: transcriptional regulator AsnC [Flavobacteriales bacterium]|nr:MAG: transcriptional regulator AsnC [Flavobacteriales bacterium]
MLENYQIDKVDLEILSILMDDAKTPYTEIAKKIIVSPGTIHVRMRKLEQMGLVKGSTLLIDPTRLGYDLTAFLGVFLEKGSNYNEVIKQLEKIPEVVEAHYTTGNYSIFLKIICRNTNQLRDVLGDKVQKISGIQRTETILSLEESIKRNVKLEMVS